MLYTLSKFMSCQINHTKIMESRIIRVADNIHYHTQDRLGSGAFGTVYKGKRNNEVVAIKLAKFKDEDQKRYSQKEIDALAKLNHDNIVRYIEQIEVKQENQLKERYIVMDYCNGKTLEDEIISNTLNHQKCLKYLQEIVSAVAYVHSEGCIHRDLKPSNILIHDGVVKLCDFGVSTLCEVQKIHVSAERTNLGTPHYKSPQMLENGNSHTNYSSKCDVWALGIVFYKMLERKFPQGRSKGAFIGLQGDYPDLFKEVIRRTLDFQTKTRIVSSELETLINKEYNATMEWIRKRNLKNMFKLRNEPQYNRDEESDKVQSNTYLIKQIFRYAEYRYEKNQLFSQYASEVIKWAGDKINECERQMLTAIVVGIFNSSFQQVSGLLSEQTITLPHLPRSLHQTQLDQNEKDKFLKYRQEFLGKFTQAKQKILSLVQDLSSTFLCNNNYQLNKGLFDSFKDIRNFIKGKSAHKESIFFQKEFAKFFLQYQCSAFEDFKQPESLRGPYLACFELMEIDKKFSIDKLGNNPRLESEFKKHIRAIEAQRKNVKSGI